MVKPIGPVCNLACEYCFYLGKEALFPQVEDFQMTDGVLAEYVKQYITNQPGPVVPFAWQGEQLYWESSFPTGPGTAGPLPRDGR